MKAIIIKIIYLIFTVIFLYKNKIMLDDASSDEDNPSNVELDL
jgi:hypothetical protein